MTKLGSYITWIFLYVVGIALIINLGAIVVGIYSMFFMIIYGIFEPILRESFMEFPSSKDAFRRWSPGNEDSIRTMLEYYDVKEVIKWCMTNYKWDEGHALERVKQVMKEIKND